MDVCDAAPQPALRPGVASVAVAHVIELVRQYASLDRRISDGRMQSFLRTINDCNMIKVSIIKIILHYYLNQEKNLFKIVNLFISNKDNNNLIILSIFITVIKQAVGLEF